MTQWQLASMLTSVRANALSSSPRFHFASSYLNFTVANQLPLPPDAT